MDNFSLIEKLKILMDIVISSPVFLVCSILSIAILIFLIFCILKNKKINKWLFISFCLVILLTLMLRYYNVVFSLIDNFFDNVFMALYFPNLTTYIILLVISNSFFIYSLFKKDLHKLFKIINSVNSLILDFFLVLIIGIVSSNNINISDTLTIYSNSNLLVLFQLTTGVFTSWILLSLLISAYNKLKKYDIKDVKVMPEIIFDE